MTNPGNMSKSDQLLQILLKRAKERIGIIDDFEGLYDFLEAAAEEALEEKFKKAKGQESSPAK